MQPNFIENFGKIKNFIKITKIWQQDVFLCKFERKENAAFLKKSLPKNFI